MGASQVTLVVKNLPANAGDARKANSVPGSGRSPGGGHGNPFQYSRLENPTDRGAGWAMVHRATKSWTQLKHLSMHACTDVDGLDFSLADRVEIIDSKVWHLAGV